MHSPHTTASGTRGYAVPDEDVRRRLPRSLANLAPALRLADQARVIDNGSAETPYREVADFTDGNCTVLGHVPTWAGQALSRFS
jgi:predicted ABC-type ATPase